ncbi:ATP-dependent Clp protease ATP-binding subunit, partial [Bacillus pseudomycoides]|nr:ATP-dependent Clp protease ATP-binding subunit [Bacillus pseudomycoides]
NIIDEIIVFHMLEKKQIQEIVTLMVNQLVNRLKEQESELELTSSAIESIADKIFDREYGARPLRRAIQKHVEDRMSEE